MWMAEKNTLKVFILQSKLYSGHITQWYVASLLALEEVGEQVQILAGPLTVFFSFLFF